MAWRKTVSEATTRIQPGNGFVPASGTAARSVCFAFKTSDTYSTQRYMGGWGVNAVGEAYRWRLDPTYSYSFRIEVNSGNIVFSTTGLNDGNWHFVVFGSDASADIVDTVCYIDGTLQTTTTSASRAINTATTYGLHIGVDYGQVVSNGTFGPVCEYAEVAVFDRKLSAGEMIALSKGVSPALLPNGRLQYWPLIRQYVDYDGSTAPSVVGSNYTISTHPPIIYPSAQKLQFPLAAATGPVITRVYTDSATQYAASATSVAITIDNSVQAGDLISIYWMCRSAFTVPSGWTSYHEVQLTGFNQRSGILLKTSDGTEGGTTVTLTQASAGRIEGMHAIHRSSTGALAYSQGQGLDAGNNATAAQTYTCPGLTESGEFLVLVNTNNVYSNANELGIILHASADAEYGRLNTTAQPNTDANRLCCFEAIYEGADTSVLVTTAITANRDVQISMLTVVPVSGSGPSVNWNGLTSYNWNGVTSFNWNGIS
jgi:hypothetical protein